MVPYRSQRQIHLALLTLLHLAAIDGPVSLLAAKNAIIFASSTPSGYGRPDWGHIPSLIKRERQMRHWRRSPAALKPHAKLCDNKLRNFSVGRFWPNMVSAIWTM